MNCDTVTEETGKDCQHQPAWFVRVGERESDEHHACSKHLASICRAMLGQEINGSQGRDIWISVRPIPVWESPFKYFRRNGGPMNLPLSKFQAEELTESFQTEGKLTFLLNQQIMEWGIIRYNKSRPWLEVTDSTVAKAAVYWYRDRWAEAAKTNWMLSRGLVSLRLLADRLTRLTNEREGE